MNVVVSSFRRCIAPHRVATIFAKNLRVGFVSRTLAAFATVWLFLFVQTCAAQTQQTPITRSTNDRDADLIKALIVKGRFDDGIEICEGMVGILEPSGEAAAKWRIFLSQVHSAKYQAGQSFGTKEIQIAKQPVDDLIKRYPDHRRRLFLNVQSTAVEIAAARHAIVIASVSPAGEQQQNQILQTTTEINSTVDDLIKQIREQVSGLLSNQPTLTDRALAGDLKRLDHELQITSVSLKLMQSEIFERDGADFIDATGQAAIAARATLSRLPSNVPATLEIRRLLVESLVRAGQQDRAESELKTLLSQIGPNPPAIIRALMVKLLISKGDRINADKILRAFYGNDVNSAPASMPMDLAKLQFLLSSDTSDSAGSVGDWLATIEKRNGLFARRRAESIALSRLGNNSATKTMANPAIIAAQGEDWLRRGEPERGAKLLLAAAKAESNGERALALGVKSAAAFLSIDQKENAASVLAHIATSNPKSKGAAPLQLQAAMLMSQLGAKAKPETIEKTLRDLIRIWPEDPKAADAKRWLFKILDSSGRELEAARTATSFISKSSEPDEVNDALRQWANLILNSQESDTKKLINECEGQFELLLEESSTIDKAFTRYATVIVDPESLTRFRFNEKTEESKFLDSILQFRKGTESAVSIEGVDLYWIQMARWRLLRDGNENPARRKSIAQLLRTWSADDPWQSVRVQLWSGDTDAAIDKIKELISESKDPGKDRRRAARLLGSQSSIAAQDAAVEIWDGLAGGIPKGSQGWHEAKLAAMALLTKTGKKDEAIKRAKYILLTSPPKDENLRSKYEAIAK